MNLQNALLHLKENIYSIQILNSIRELKTSIEDELDEGTPQRISVKELTQKAAKVKYIEKISAPICLHCPQGGVWCQHSERC